MKKLISWILIFALSGIMNITVNAEEVPKWDGVTFDTSWYNTSEKSFTISTPAQFAGFAQIVAGRANGISKDSFGGKTVTLGADLDFADEALQPVGVATSAFKGIFDGNGHIIKNVRIIPWSGDENAEVGLFARVQGGTIKKLGVENIEVSYSLDSAAKGNYFSGGLAGHIREKAVIEDCFVRNITLSDFTNDGALFGGLVGQIRAGATIEACYTTSVSSGMNVTASNALISNFVAKITSHAGDTIISNCYAGVYNEFKGVDEVLGAVGTENSSAQISNVYYDACENLNSWIGKTAGTFVTSENLIAIDGEVSLSDGFIVNEDTGYNYGYPILSWEMNGTTDEPIEEDVVFEVVTKTENSVELTYIENAFYSIDGIEWTNANVFENLTKGIYKFYMKTAETADKVYELITSVGDRFDEFDVWDGSVDTSWYNAEENVFYISTAAEYAGFVELSRATSNANFTDKEINLMSNLDLSNRDIKPAGYGASYFGGTFNGNGHIIKNVKVIDSADREIGLFGRVDGTVKNLGVENISLNSEGDPSKNYNAGGFVGYLRYGSIENCFVRNVDATALENKVTYLGGFVGYARAAQISSCYVVNFTLSDTDISADRIANFASNVIETSKLNGCYSASDNGLQGYDIIGFAQAASTASLSNCYYDTLGNGAGSGNPTDALALKELKVLDDCYKPAYDAEYNLGYPVLEWEKFEDVTYSDIALYSENGQVYFKISGFKNNTESTINPVAVCAVYKDGYMTDAGCEIVADISEYSLYGDIIVMAQSEGDEAKGMLYTSCDKGIPLIKSLELN